MPPKARITKDMIINAAVEIAKQNGYENINARTVSKQLHCSTQPVIYHFSTIEALKQAAYVQTDQMHTRYLMTVNHQQHPILSIGINYIRFAVKEPHLFRFLFQSGYAKENNLLEMIDSKELIPLLEAMQKSAGLSTEKIKQVFMIVALFAHGYASIIANNGLEYDEKLIAKHLELAWNGALSKASDKGEEK